MEKDAEIGTRQSVWPLITADEFTAATNPGVTPGTEINRQHAGIGFKASRLLLRSKYPEGQRHTSFELIVPKIRKRPSCSRVVNTSLFKPMAEDHSDLTDVMSSPVTVAVSFEDS